jgi:hypothetical protein
MFEGLVTSLLRRYLGDYIDDIKEEDIQVAVTSGEAVIRNLRLKPSALDFMDMPIEVVHGFVGQLRLKIPFTSLSSEPWVVEFDRIYAVARVRYPKTTAEPEEVRAARLAQQIKDKLEKLQAHELKLFSPQVCPHSQLFQCNHQHHTCANFAWRSVIGATHFSFSILFLSFFLSFFLFFSSTTYAFSSNRATKWTRRQTLECNSARKSWIACNCSFKKFTCVLNTFRMSCKITSRNHLPSV